MANTWQEAFQDYILKDQEDIDYLAETNTTAKVNDVGFINEDTGAGILAKDDGSIELSSDYGLGFKFDPKYKAMLVFAPNIHIFSDNIQTHKSITKGNYINGEYQEVLDILKGQ